MNCCECGEYCCPFRLIWIETCRGVRERLDIRVRVDIIGHARIRYVGKSQSCMV